MFHVWYIRCDIIYKNRFFEKLIFESLNNTSAGACMHPHMHVWGADMGPVYGIRYTGIRVYGYTVYGIRYTVYGIRYSVYGIRVYGILVYGIRVYGIRVYGIRVYGIRVYGIRVYGYTGIRYTGIRYTVYGNLPIFAKK